ncbi:hypothetical protein JAAARDRAFT_200261 [Jaapia argillacea MUCL 33604]|uniref:Uncharacterized protein n=1 Tax=Jaapia argillacea MUCL 33604 TaxID=933084 RepID=A0A067P5A8_9AGAM|nr:hypothetical protein JAAARDRAFT_200261 [Jaapia argillacea MUCL 33604]
MPTTREHESTQATYARLMLAHQHGYPLYQPEPTGPPNLPGEYHQGGYQIGDVGTITDNGGFDVFFNFCHTHEDPINARGVPPNFRQVPLDPNTVTTSIFLPHTISCSSIKNESLGVTFEPNGQNPVVPFGGGLGYEYSSETAEGAIAVLPERAERADVTRRRDRFLTRATEDAVGWYKWINGTGDDDLGAMIGHRSLYLITGFDKSTCWAGTAYSSTTNNTAFRATFKVASVSSAGIQRKTYNWESYTHGEPRVQLHHPQHPENRYLTPFIRGFRITPRKLVPARLLGPVVVSDVQGSVLPGIGLLTRFTSFFSWGDTPPNDDQGGSSAGAEMGNSRGSGYQIDVTNVPVGESPYHPADFVNEYLLNKFPEAQIAIVHDDQWSNVLTEGELLPDAPELTRRILKKYIPCYESGQ